MSVNILLTDRFKQHPIDCFCCFEYQTATPPTTTTTSITITTTTATSTTTTTIVHCVFACVVEIFPSTVMKLWKSQ